MMTQTSEQVAREFRLDLQALLDKYGAELEARDFWVLHSECGDDVRMEVTVPALYDSELNCIREWTHIDLGTNIFPSK
jgi:hypothetical protein